MKRPEASASAFCLAPADTWRAREFKRLNWRLSPACAGQEAVGFSCRVVTGAQTSDAAPISAGGPCTAQHLSPYGTDLCSGSVGTGAGWESLVRGAGLRPQKRCWQPFSSISKPRSISDILSSWCTLQTQVGLGTPRFLHPTHPFPIFCGHDN